jgi:hypothetical protein
MSVEIQKTARNTGVFVPKDGPEDRPALRPEVRDDDPRAAAAERAAEIRKHLGGLDEGTDEFYIDPLSIPDGWTYEWKRFSTYNKEDFAYLNAQKRAGWSPVPASRHPDKVPDGQVGGHIEYKGSILMERPTEIVNERKAIAARLAQNQVRQKEAQLNGSPDGTFERQAKVRKSYEPIPVPKD